MVNGAFMIEKTKTSEVFSDKVSEKSSTVYGKPSTKCTS